MVRDDIILQKLENVHGTIDVFLFALDVMHDGLSVHIYTGIRSNPLHTFYLNNTAYTF